MRHKVKKAFTFRLETLYKFLALSFIAVGIIESMKETCRIFNFWDILSCNHTLFILTGLIMFSIPLISAGIEIGIRIMRGKR